MPAHSVASLTAFLAAGSFLAGLLGSLTGLGGGVVLIPMMTLLFGIDIRYAIGASLVSVIATSSGAASAYVKEGYTNVRLGMILEVATSVGAIAGAAIAVYANTRFIGLLFGAVLLQSAWSAFQGAHEEFETHPPVKRLAMYLRLDGTYPVNGREKRYYVQSFPSGFALMGVAGLLSGLLGIGSGAMKVIAMDRIMKIPFKVSTTTSNFMIGVTAAASAGVYLARGYIEPGLAMPVMLGVLAGSLTGARILTRASTPLLRRVFGIVIAILAAQMIYSGIMGKL